MTVTPFPQPAEPEALPLYDENAEMAVVGSVLRSETALSAVIEHIGAGDFYLHHLATIFRAAIDLWGAGEPVDPITVHAKLEERGELNAAGGKAKVHEVAAHVTATANAAHHAKIVRELSVLRSLAAAGHGIVRMTAERGDEHAEPRREGRAAAVRGFAARDRGRARPAPRVDGADVRARQPPLRAGGDGHRARERLSGPRPGHRGVPARQPHHPGRPAVDGEERARALHGGERLRAARGSPPRSSASRCRRRRLRSG